MSVATWRHTGNVRIYPPHDPVPQTFIKLRLITSAGRKDQIRKAAHHSSSSSCSHSTLVLPPSPNSPSPHSGRGVWLCAAAAWDCTLDWRGGLERCGALYPKWVGLNQGRRNRGHTRLETRKNSESGACREAPSAIAGPTTSGLVSPTSPPIPSHRRAAVPHYHHCVARGSSRIVPVQTAASRNPKASRSI